MSDSDFMDDVDLQNEDFAVWAKAREAERREPDSCFRVYTYSFRPLGPKGGMVPFVQSFLTQYKPVGVELNKPVTYIDEGCFVAAELYTDKTSEEARDSCLKKLYSAVCIRVKTYAREVERQKMLIYAHSPYKMDKWEG